MVGSEIGKKKSGTGKGKKKSGTEKEKRMCGSEYAKIKQKKLLEAAGRAPNQRSLADCYTEKPHQINVDNSSGGTFAEV